MNNFLSGALSLANAAIFAFVVFACAVQVYEGELELLEGVLISAVAAAICGFIATLMVIKDRLQGIEHEVYNLRRNCNSNANNISALIEKGLSEEQNE